MIVMLVAPFYYEPNRPMENAYPGAYTVVFLVFATPLALYPIDHGSNNSTLHKIVLRLHTHLQCRRQGFANAPDPARALRTANHRVASTHVLMQTMASKDHVMTYLQ